MIPLPEDIEMRTIRVPGDAFVIRKVCEQYQRGQIIDIGCGNGRKTRLIGRLGVDILGVDPDEQEIRKARNANTYENVQFACRQMKDMPDNTFSGVLLLEVLEHTDDPLQVLQEVYRLCENEGFFLLTIPNGYSLKEIVAAIVHRSSEHSNILAKGVERFRKMARRDEVFNESQHVQWFTLKRIRSLLEKAGFVIQEERYYSVWSSFFWLCFPWIKIPLSIKKLERRVEKYLPHYVLEGWGFYCVKKNR